MKLKELVEHKGIGHPDTIADNIAERLSELLEEVYILEYGTIQHYNVDKVLVTTKNGILFVVFAGQCTKIPKKYKLYELLDKAACYAIYDLAKLKVPKEKIAITNMLNLGAPELRSNFNRKRCNDTSYAVGFYPLTVLENLVLRAVSFVKHSLKDFPGSDFKIMGAQFSDGSIKLTVAKAFICDRKDIKKYNELKTNFKKYLQTQIYPHIDITVNNADKGKSIFATKWGSSLEGGDSGMVGRGNRLNGLITPMRPMTLEAYHGKNNQTHIGKTYQILAQKIAKEKKKQIVIYNEIGNKLDDYEIAEI